MIPLGASVRPKAANMKLIFGPLLCIAVCLTVLSAAGAQQPSLGLPQADNLALGQTVQFNTPPNDVSSTDPDDVHQLTDGKLSPATPMWYDKASVGWALIDPTVFTLDLGAIQPIRGVGLHMGAGQAGVEWPTSLEIHVSDDGVKYSHVGNLMQLLSQRPPEQGYASFWLTTDKLETHGRFVRLVCTPINLGNGAYIMLDEAEVYRGDAAWLSRPLLWPDAPPQWRADWSAIHWTDNAAATPPSERPTHLLLIDGGVETGGDAPLQQAVPGKEGMTFTLHGEAGKLRSMSWTGMLAKPISTDNCRCALLTLRAEGLRRTYDMRPLISLQGVGEGATASDVTLLEVNQAMNDGLTHTLVRPLPAGFTLSRLKVFLPSENDAPHLTVERLELLHEAPEVFSPETATPPAQATAALPVDLGAALNGSLREWYDRVLRKYGLVFDGARALPTGIGHLSGIPFTIAPGEKNLALMPDTPEKNERVPFLGQTVDSCYLQPVSRDDSLTVDADAVAREAFLLLAFDAPPVQPRGGIPYTARRLDDIESLSVELIYDRGESEVAFPYSLADRACVIPARELGAYAVAVDPTRRLKKIALHNHQFGVNFALAAVTLNTSDKPLVPELATFPPPERTATRQEPPVRPVAITQQGSRLTFSTRWFECSLNLAEGFVLDRFVNRWNAAAKIQLAPNAGLRVRVGDTVYTGRCFRAEVVRVTGTQAELRLTSTRAELPLEIMVTITASDAPELRFAIETRNLGDTPLPAELCLPALAGLSVGDLARTRLFFPQYRVVDTGDDIALRAPYGPEFSTQFMDIYSRPAGIGLMIRTDNREQRMANFTLRKDAGGVAGGVCFPADFSQLDPGATRAYPPVSLFAHGGDWHAAFGLYRDWVRTWYQPFKAQDEPFFLNAWDLTCYRPSEKLSWREARVPGFISPDRQRFLSEETFQFEQRNLGHIPDLIHFYNWTYDDQKEHDEYGAFSTPLAYAQVGGLESLRRGIAEIQTRWQRPVSLYTLNDRFRASALPDQALARELTGAARYKELDNDASAALRGAGQVDGVYFPPFGTPRWTDFFVNDIIKMQRDTGCQIVYMDVMPRFSNLRGYPGVSPRDDDLNVAKRIREGLPDEVAVWTEYPYTDVASQYTDGCLQYYFLELNETFARRYNHSDRAGDLFAEMPLNIGRYALTRYRTIDLPGYIEASSKPGQVDAVFVNGEVFHEDTFRLHRSRERVKINRAYVVKRQYADCFSSDHPMPWVDTAASGLTANLFPGQNRNVWTLYNGRPKTYSGVVLVVPHRTGAKYRDAWHDRELKPVIANGMARISVTLGPQQPGCVVQEWTP